MAQDIKVSQKDNVAVNNLKAFGDWLQRAEYREMIIECGWDMVGSRLQD